MPHAPPSLFKAALTMRCPRCGQGRLFKGYLTQVPSCTACGLDFSQADTGDGPAVFVILLVGFIVVALALYVEIAYAPPLWLHALLWTPLTLLLALALIRPLKALMIALQYRHQAGEGRPE